MSLSGNALGDAIRSAIDALTDVQKRDRTAVFHAMGQAIVAYFIANAQVVVTSVSGVTVGGGVSGPGTGTVI